MPMPSPNLLQQLHDLDRSSPEFPNQLTDILLGEVWVRCLQGLPREGFRPFVKYLDTVLNSLDPTSYAFCRCLFELRRICGTHKILPISHVLSDAFLDIGDRPIASETLANTHTGTLKDLQVCAKRLRVYSTEEPDKVELFYQEAIVWKRMDHPNIVPFLGVTLEPLQLVSDRMEGGNLIEYINGRPGVNRLGLLCDVAEGLNHLHSHSVVHGNITGGNILVDHLGRARITNFVLAEFSHINSSFRRVMKTRDYSTRWTAPEVLDEKGPPTKEADIFSFGMVMYEVFAGVIPFNQFPSFTSMVKIMHGERPLRPINSTLSNNMWALMEMCWDQDPRSRPTTGEVLQDLVSGLFRSLRQFTGPSAEFQVALSQFYDSTEWKSYVSHLCGSELKEFINLLDDVLCIKGLARELVQQTLLNLQDVFDDLAVHPEFGIVRHGFTRLTTDPYVVSNRAKVWKGRLNIGGAGDHPLEACLKVIKTRKVHKGFRGEVAAWAKLDHPNILRCLGLTVHPVQIMTEWMSNGQAIEYVQVHKSADRVRLLIDVARGLDYLHSREVVHGNLKQQNILVDSAGRACLTDIGPATLHTPNDGSQSNWADVGADGYRWVAPEIFQCSKFSKQSDVFSYGFVAAEIFVGEVAWKGIDTMVVKSKIARGERPGRPECEKKRPLTIGLWRMFAKCWEAEPGSRISASEVLSFLLYLPQPISGASYNLEKVTAMLETNMISRRERPKFLNQLCKMCDFQRSLPNSMVIPSIDNISVAPACGGGSAEVFQGKYRGRQVAIKVMRVYVSGDRGLDRSRFCREAIAWRHLRHTNVLPLLGVMLEQNRFAFVSEWMDNGNINGFIRGRKDVNRVQLLVDVAHGLEYLHSLNFVHGDLKGANILIKKDHRACLADFGYSTIVYVAPRLSADRISVSSVASEASIGSKVSLMGHESGGTFEWMSPELLDPEKFGMKDRRPTKQSDCYALGMVIYEVLCGKTPYSGHEGNAILAIVKGVRPGKPPAAATLGFTDDLWWMVECCWMTDCGLRPDVKTVLSHLTYAASAWERG